MIAVNPFRWLDIHNTRTSEKYLKTTTTDNKHEEPHVFRTATLAFKRLTQQRKPQCFIISGESGSGKTTCTQHLLDQIEKLNKSNSSSKSFRSNYSNSYRKHVPNLLQKDLSELSTEKMISAAVPLLDAFGNASTLVNHNSSRFGKYIKLKYNDSGKLRGASISRYLLEKSRLVKRDSGDKNFHIFYYLDKSININDYEYLKESDGSSPPKYQLNTDENYWNLSPAERMRIIQKESSENNFHSDKETNDRIQQYQKALDAVGINQTAEIQNYLKVILLLGNVQFKTASSSLSHGQLEIKNPEVIGEISELLVLPEREIIKQLTIKQLGDDTKEHKLMKDLKDLKSATANLTNLSTNSANAQKFNENTRILTKNSSLDSVIMVPYTLNEAIQRRDAFAKTLYSQLFDWILQECNGALASTGDQSQFEDKYDFDLSIGVLDIFGFENQKRNSFEQFCINFANERLQLYCQKNVYIDQQNLYKDEGIELGEFNSLNDSKCCVDMFSRKPTGLFYVLNDQGNTNREYKNLNFNKNNSNFNSKNNEKFVSGENLVVSMVEIHKNSKIFNVPKLKEYEPVFTITHYAGDVKYTATDFNVKNHDRPSKECLLLMRKSGNSFVRNQVFGRSKLALYHWRLLRAAFRVAFVFKRIGKTGISGLGLKTKLLSPRFTSDFSDEDIEFSHGEDEDELYTTSGTEGDYGEEEFDNEPRLEYSYDLWKNKSLLTKPDFFTSGEKHGSSCWDELEDNSLHIRENVMKFDDVLVLKAKLLNRKIRAQAVLHRQKLLEKGGTTEKRKSIDDFGKSGRKTSFDGGNSLSSSGNFSSGTFQSKQSKTISEEYMHSIQDLISELDASNPCFIRCLRSNEYKDPENFDSKYVQQQLIYNGLIQTQQLSQRFYLIDQEKNKTQRICQFIATKRKLDFHSSVKDDFGGKVMNKLDQDEKLQNFLESHTELDASSFYIGKTKVFFKTQEDFDKLESVVQSVYKEAASKIQGNYRIFREKSKLLAIASWWRTEAGKKKEELARYQSSDEEEPVLVEDGPESRPESRINLELVSENDVSFEDRLDVDAEASGNEIDDDESQFVNEIEDDKIVQFTVGDSSLSRGR